MEKWLHLRDAGLQMLVLLLLGLSTVPCAAAKPVTVDQLEQILSDAHDSPDTQIAAQLSELVLVERLSGARLARCEAGLRGLRSQQALIALADISAFLDPPAAEIPTTARPDAATQRKMIALAVDYVSQTIHQLPNLFATRVTTSFQDNPAFDESKMGANRRSVPDVLIINKPLHQVGRYSAAVLYRRGKEETHSQSTQSGPQGLTTSGEFGPILTTSLLDAAQGNLAWSRWEQGNAGPEAVFRFVVPAEKSHYDVGYCCIIKGHGTRVYFQQRSAYEGEITIDPSNGTILRLSLRASLKKTDPIVKANIVVEYAPVELGGRTYICPVKGIALSLASEVQPGFGGTEEDFPPLQTSLNDVAFEQYHLYHATSRILPADGEEPSPTPPAVDKKPN
jgi:hypothetical protein